MGNSTFSLGVATSCNRRRGPSVCWAKLVDDTVGVMVKTWLKNSFAGTYLILHGELA